MTYQLPLMGHDMPEGAPPAPLRFKAQVFRAFDGHWCWKHRCEDGAVRLGLLAHQTQPGALRAALQHLKGCS